MLCREYGVLQQADGSAACRDLIADVDLFVIFLVTVFNGIILARCRVIRPILYRTLLRVIYNQAIHDEH